jgi:hypothetical protein
LSIAIGNFATSCGTNSIVLGAAGVNTDGGACAESSIAIGSGNRVALANAFGAIAIGGNSSAGLGTCTRATAECAITLGFGSVASAECAIALGAGITASVANYTTTRNLQLTNYAALDFADDTAAAAGGVPLGGSYHNSGAARIRIA